MAESIPFLSKNIPENPRELFWSQVADDANFEHSQSYIPSQNESSEDIDPREMLFNESQDAKRNLVNIGVWLVSEAIEDGDPGRDIVSHPDYMAAQQRSVDAIAAIKSFLNY